MAIQAGIGKPQPDGQHDEARLHHQRGGVRDAVGEERESHKLDDERAYERAEHGRLAARQQRAADGDRCDGVELDAQADPETGRWLGLSGVNVTLGLPFIRTSVDHGTAFDIAGRGTASAQSMKEAIDFAFNLAALPSRAVPSPA